MKVWAACPENLGSRQRLRSDVVEGMESIENAEGIINSPSILL